MANYYDWIKVLHVLAVISWMVGMLYLPRLFVYHTRAKQEESAYGIFVEMERRLLKVIMAPAMIVTYVTGLMMAHVYGLHSLGDWFMVKFIAVLAMSGFHGYLSVCAKQFQQKSNRKTECFFRLINEVPAVLMTVILAMVIVKPFN